MAVPVDQRSNLKLFGWAGEHQNVGFIAGKLRRDTSKPNLIFIQQTPAVEQSIPILIDAALSQSAYPDGTMISVMARIVGSCTTDLNDVPVEGVALARALNVRYAEAREVSAAEARRRLDSALSKLPQGAVIADISSGDIVAPDEVLVHIPQVPLSSVDTDALQDTKVSMLKGSNMVSIAGIIASMEFREPAVKNFDNSGARLTLFLLQKEDPKYAIPVRMYGKDAVVAANLHEPGHAVAVQGRLLVDVKKTEAGNLDLKPYVHTTSITWAVPHVHIRQQFDWHLKLRAEGESQEGYLKRVRRVRQKPKADKVPGNGSVANENGGTVQE